MEKIDTTNYKLRILIIEDDSSIIDMIYPVLKKLDAEIITSPNQALELIERNHYDLLLVDLHFYPDPLDVFSGLDFIKNCRKHGIQTPIVAMSNYDYLEDKVIRFGANYFLSKKSYHPTKWKEVINSLTLVQSHENN